MATRQAILLIADIGGYTEYMNFHRSVLGHAEAATTRMLDKIVDAAKGFELIEIEGDAAFLSRDVDGLDGAAALAMVTDVALALNRAFHRERRYVELNMCPCGSCTKTSELKLKFVAHVGEVATQTIRRHKKLVGLDVIHVHRLLKNSVPVPEYVLVSDELFVFGGATSGALPMHDLAMELEGIGSVTTHYVDLADISTLEPFPDPSWPQRIGGTFAMVGRGLPYVLRRKQPRALSSVG